MGFENRLIPSYISGIARQAEYPINQVRVIRDPFFVHVFFKFEYRLGGGILVGSQKIPTIVRG